MAHPQAHCIGDKATILPEQATNVGGETLGARGIPISEDASRNLICGKWFFRSNATQPRLSIFLSFLILIPPAPDFVTIADD